MATLTLPTVIAWTDQLIHHVAEERRAGKPSRRTRSPGFMQRPCDARGDVDLRSRQITSPVLGTGSGSAASVRSCSIKPQWPFREGLDRCRPRWMHPTLSRLPFPLILAVADLLLTNHDQTRNIRGFC
jgi:hypothetical protein